MMSTWVSPVVFTNKASPHQHVHEIKNVKVKNFNILLFFIFSSLVTPDLSL